MPTRSDNVLSAELPAPRYGISNSSSTQLRNRWIKPSCVPQFLGSARLINKTASGLLATKA